jgi:hypothetical protein
MSLLLSQKNELFSMIEAEGLSPGQFSFELVPSQYDQFTQVAKLSYAHTDYFFLFDRKGRRNFHSVLYSPGLHDFETEANPGTDWHLVKAYVKEWLQNLKRELGQEDKWESLALVLANNRASFAEEGDGKFSVQEYELLASRLDQAANRLPEADLNEEEIEVLRVKFEHMKKMGKTLDKSDWQGLFIGTLVSTLNQLGVSPETAQEIWELLKQIFNNLLLE